MSIDVIRIQKKTQKITPGTPTATTVTRSKLPRTARTWAVLLTPVGPLNTRHLIVSVLRQISSAQSRTMWILLILTTKRLSIRPSQREVNDLAIKFPASIRECYPNLNVSSVISRRLFPIQSTMMYLHRPDRSNETINVMEGSKTQKCWSRMTLAMIKQIDR